MIKHRMADGSTVEFTGKNAVQQYEKFLGLLGRVNASAGAPAPVEVNPTPAPAPVRAVESNSARSFILKVGSETFREGSTALLETLRALVQMRDAEVRAASVVTCTSAGESHQVTRQRTARRVARSILYTHWGSPLTRVEADKLLGIR